MKIIIASFTTLAAFIGISSTSNAFVVHPGSFVASRCGATNNDFVVADVKVNEVCVGQVDGPASDVRSLAVTFRLSNEATMMFKVKSVGTNLVAYLDRHSDMIYNLQGPTGETAEMTVTVTDRNELVKASGSMGTIPFFVPSFSESLIAR